MTRNRIAPSFLFIFLLLKLVSGLAGLDQPAVTPKIDPSVWENLPHPTFQVTYPQFADPSFDYSFPSFEVDPAP